jgi:hypothetical protein
MSAAGVGDLPEECIDQPDSSGDVATTGGQLEGPSNQNLASFATQYAKNRKLRGEQLTDVDNFVKVHTLSFQCSHILSEKTGHCGSATDQALHRTEGNS